MKTVDLHVHSTFSDGTLTPSDLVREAIKCNLSAFALTDHDTVKGIPEAIEAAGGHDLEIIPGIEVSTFYLDKEIHIVGLFVDYKSEVFAKELDKEVARRNERNLVIIERMNEMGIRITYEELQEIFPDRIIARPHFAHILVKHGFAKDIPDAFSKYLAEDMPLYVPRKRNTPKEAIELIKSAGGAAILAHPLLYHLSFGELSKLCRELKEYGLDGIETLYSANRGFDELTVRKLAKEFDLLESGGSDFHGQNKPHIKMGTGCGSLVVPYSLLDKIRDSVS